MTEHWAPPKNWFLMRDKLFKEGRAAPLWQNYVGYDFLQELNNLVKDQAQPRFQHPPKSHLKYQPCPSTFWSIQLGGFIRIQHLHWRKADLTYKSHSLNETGIWKTKNSWGIFYQKGNILCNFFFFYFVQSWGRSRDWALLQNCCQFKAAQPRSVAPWQRWMLSSLASETLLILISKLNNFLSSNHRVSTNRWARLGTGCWTLPELLRANLAED